MKKVIVIGLDGLEPTLVNQMLAAGLLPNLASLRAKGGYGNVQTTYPPQTPVAWSTFATGTNPGGHGIFDFLRRDPRTYLPSLALNGYEQKNMFTAPRAVNLRGGTAVWDLLTQAGISSTIVRCPCTFPPEEIHGRILAGVGVPDLRGGLGTSTFYTSQEGVNARESEKVLHVQIDSSRTIQTHVVGPRNPKTRADLRFDITLHIEPEACRVQLHSSGQPELLEIRAGEWSDWLHVKFKLGLLQMVRGMVRFHLVRVEPVFELYASSVNFEPEAPLFPISSPPDYAAQLERALGTFHTTGMAEDYDGLINGRFDESAYLRQCETVLHERVKMMLFELERFDQGLLFCLFDTPDRIQHMFWRFQEPDHPANLHHGLNHEFISIIEDHYHACDAVVGKALRYVDDDTLLIVLSDHGMKSFRRGLNLNTWLHQEGWLVLEKGACPGDEPGDFFQTVDWGHTKAYALGLGGIFLNIRGREAQGIVEPHETGSIKRAIAERLTGLVDPQHERVAIHSVIAREQIYSGPYLEQAPDLLVNFNEGYRVSWDTPLGGVPAGLFEDNTRKWGGDHMLNPTLVPGVLFMNRTFDDKNAALVDLAPTILATLGVPKGPNMEGKALLL